MSDDDRGGMMPLAFVADVNDLNGLRRGSMCWPLLQIIHSVQEDVMEVTLTLDAAAMRLLCPIDDVTSR